MSKSTTTVTIDEDLLKQAREMKINVSNAAEKGLEVEVRSLERERLKRLYREAAKEIDKVIQEDGLFSDGVRMF